MRQCGLVLAGMLLTACGAEVNPLPSASTMPNVTADTMDAATSDGSPDIGPSLDAAPFANGDAGDASVDAGTPDATPYDGSAASDASDAGPVAALLGTWTGSGNCTASALDYSSCTPGGPGCDPQTFCTTYSYALSPWTSTLTVIIGTPDAGAQIEVTGYTSSSGAWKRFSASGPVQQSGGFSVPGFLDYIPSMTLSGTFWGHPDTPANYTMSYSGSGSFPLNGRCPDRVITARCEWTAPR